MFRIHEMPFGAETGADATRFALWAPTAREVALVIEGTVLPMADRGDGWRRETLPGVGAGSCYRYRIDGHLLVPDPASRFQPQDVAGPSAVVDPASYRWRDAGWQGRPWEEAVLYEVHIGTATPEGTFTALAAKLDELRDLGITAIELMPLADFPGQRNWGYDGVLPFAPDSRYGTPDDLKALIDRAHGLGLMVLVDVVYNHFGPAGNFLHAYAETFFTERHRTPWGAAINFDGSDAAPVRAFFVHNALYWLTEFHADGLRLDAVHAICDDGPVPILAEIGERARAVCPGREVHLVLENDANEARWLTRQDGRPRFYTAQWNDDLHHCWHTLLTGESDGYYEDYADAPAIRLGRCLAEGFAYQGEPSRHRGGEPRGEPSAELPPGAFVAFLQNHDQVGNRALGERLHRLAAPEKLDLARAALLLSPQIPLLFMGEDWAASTPFLYFVDFADEPELGRAVREGRRREFAGFARFGSGGADVPDPTAAETFARSALDWAERSRPEHAAVLSQTRALLQLRRQEVLPLTRTRFLGAARAERGPHQLDVTWHFAGGGLRFLANVDAATWQAPVAAERIVWTSPQIRTETGSVCLPPWTGAWLRGAP